MKLLNTAELKKVIASKMTEDVVYAINQQFEVPQTTQAVLSKPRAWKRMGKFRVKTEYDDTDFRDILLTDVYAEINQNASNYAHVIGDCWMRCFIPKQEELQDFFRVEIVTNPSDTEIIGWAIIVD